MISSRRATERGHEGSVAGVHQAVGMERAGQPEQQHDQQRTVDQEREPDRAQADIGEGEDGPKHEPDRGKPGDARLEPPAPGSGYRKPRQKGEGGEQWR